MCELVCVCVGGGGGGREGRWRREVSQRQDIP